MKKVLFTFFVIFLFPLGVFAYSKYIIPGGESIGIKINTEGLVVVGFYKVEDEYIAKNNFKIGDKIINVNGKNVNTIDELTDAVSKSEMSSLNVKVIVKRNDREVDTYLKLIVKDGTYKTGLYVKDSLIGLGTLSYIDPVSKIYGALGHEITMNETGNKVDVRDGNILYSKVIGIDKSRNGKVGSKNANIIFDRKIGTIQKNTNKGIYGIYIDNLPNKETYQVADFSNIKKGDAYILTVTKDNKIEKYSINILDKYSSKKDTQKAFSFEITDKNLLNKTGGIVQGMSGSPIIQDDKIIGAVTNVLVDNVTLGYGISIITMLAEGEK
ncbi:MAG: SpoIVB peptidase S55 domain-containing protein [Bacilli bacterium]|nr:SpoIVB peptidase S55 domain-containing protein [Bacilli bacterium]